MKRAILITAGIIFATSLAIGQGAAINSTGAAADNSAMLDVSGASKGVLINRMTTAERNAILSPAQALQIYNTTTKCFEFYENGMWQTMACACTPPSAPVSATGSGATQTQITANWNSASGANGYYIDVSTANNFSSYVSGYQNFNAGNSTTCNVTGLTCGTTYYYRVRAYNNCSSSGNSDVVAYSTLSCFSCGSSININHLAGDVAPVNKSVTYGTVASTLGGTGNKCWITQNLGADNQGSSVSDASEAAAGWYWQFNRKRGFKHDGATLTPSSSWVTTIDEMSNWVAANDPCTIELGSGWRIPTYTEWYNADVNGQTGGWDQYNETFADVLKLHAGGFLNSTGALTLRGSAGVHWCGSQYSNTHGWYMYYDNDESDVYNGSQKVYGFSLRCLKD